MAICTPLKAYARQCGKNSRAGLSPDVYLIAYDSLVKVDGSTEVFTESVEGLVTAIGIGAVDKFVKYGTVLNQAGITEVFTANENGTFDVAKGLVFAINNIGSVAGRIAVEDLIGQPVAALVKLNAGEWVAFGLNGQFQLSNSDGAVNATTNGRTVTLSGSDSVLIQTVDPTIIASLIAA